MNKSINPIAALLIILVVVGAAVFVMMQKSQYDKGMFQGQKIAKPKKGG